MGQAVRFALLALLGDAVLSCSSPPIHPPPIENCDSDGGASCATVGGTGSGSGGSGGSGVDGGGAGAGNCGLISSNDPTCEACLEQNCCAQAISCSNVNVCLSLATCLASCLPSNQPCVSGCQGQNPTGASAYNNFNECMAASCAVACGTGDGGSTGGNCGQLTFQSTTCNACVTVSCCSQAAACANNQDCLVLDQCLATCQPNDATCIASCQNQAPAGVASYNGLSTCLATSCAGSCP